MTDAPSVVRFFDLPPTDGADLPADARGILDAVNQKIAAQQSIEQILDYLFSHTRDLCPCDRVSVAFLGEDGQRISSYATRADYEPVLLKDGYSEDLAFSSLAEVIRRGVPRVIDDLEEYLRQRPDSRSTALLVREGVRSSLAAPLSVEGRNVGVLFRSSRKPNSYDERVVRIHRAVSERLSQAVEKAYRIEQLQAANSAYTEMLGFISHELKSPVASMVTEGRVLAGGYLGKLEPKPLEHVQRIVRKGEYLLGLIKEYLDLARLESGRMERRARQTGDFVTEVVQPAVELIQPQAEQKQIRIVAEGHAVPIAAECDVDLLRLVLTNLVDNGVKYGRAGGEVKVTVESGPDRLLVSVWNEGDGFEPSEQARLFKKFSRLENAAAKSAKGTGVGLYLCWRIIRLHGGRIQARSEPGRWAEFWFELPQPLSE